jgi:uncharacterized protein (TIGR00725 family)
VFNIYTQTDPSSIYFVPFITSLGQLIFDLVVGTIDRCKGRGPGVNLIRHATLESMSTPARFATGAPLTRGTRAPHQPHPVHYTICVSGAAAGSCLITAKDASFEIGKEIARQGQTIVTGATTGVPYFAAQGAKEVGGISLGFSPAVSHREHINKYHLPDDAFDVVVYTGFDYSGRNLLMVRSCDAVIFVCGRIGTLNEFTTAFEDDKVLGVLLESGGITDEIAHIVKI